VILIDSNVLMYAAGSNHPHKRPSLALLRRVAAGEVEAAVDTEVLQEVLHRYRSLGRWSEGRDVYDLTRSIFGSVLPITVEVMDCSRQLMDSHPKLMARDAIHAAVCLQHGIGSLCSYDRDFDAIKELRRLEPDQAA
jgi:hypothetical protein